MVTESYPLLRRADGVFPEHLSEIVGSLGSTSAGETHERGIKVGKRLHEVLAEGTALSIVPEL